MTEEERLQFAIAAAKARKARGAQGQATDPADTSFREQAMSGVNEGLANGLGMPVDMMTMALNAGATGINTLAGTEIPQIENPVGGSETFKRLLASTISEQQPQTKAQQYGRRIGQEVGESVPMALGVAGMPGKVGTAARSNLPQYAATETAGTLGSGGAAAVAQDVAPGNPIAEMIAQLLGGATGAGLTYAATPGPKAPSLDDLRARQQSAYGKVDASTDTLTPGATDRLRRAVTDRSARDNMDPILAPKASRTASLIGDLDTPTISEVEKMRRLTGRVAGNVDPTESGLGMGMKEEITDFLDDLKPQDVAGGSPEDTVAALREGRDVTRRIKAHGAIDDALERGQRRAATSGTGGNEVNAIRQNIRSILDNPKKRAGFTPDEIEAMESIVRGTPTQNALRMIGKLSPTTGALQQLGAGGMLVGGFATSNPLLAAPPFVGMAAKGAAERSTRKGVDALQELIRNGGPVDPKRLSDAQKSAIAALFAARLSGEQ